MSRATLNGDCWGDLFLVWRDAARVTVPVRAGSRVAVTCGLVEVLAGISPRDMRAAERP